MRFSINKFCLFKCFKIYWTNEIAKKKGHYLNIKYKLGYLNKFWSKFFFFRSIQKVNESELNSTQTCIVDSTVCRFSRYFISIFIVASFEHTIYKFECAITWHCDGDGYIHTSECYFILFLFFWIQTYKFTTFYLEIELIERKKKMNMRIWLLLSQCNWTRKKSLRICDA